MSADQDRAFALNVEQPKPSAFIQWKGTDLCMDFDCICGANCHFDGIFAYVVECPHCNRQYQMPSHIYPREVTGTRDPDAKMLEPDED